MATFNDAIENLNTKKALIDNFQVCQATLGICSLLDDNAKPTFVSPYYNAVKANNPTNQPVRDAVASVVEACKDVVPTGVESGSVEEQNCQEPILVVSAGPLCRTMPGAELTTSCDHVHMPEVALPQSSSVIGCEEMDGPMGASQ